MPIITKRCASDTEEDPWDAHSSMMTWATSILLVIIFLILLWVLIIWFTVHPRPLSFAVGGAFVSNFNFNFNLNLTDRRLVTADFHIHMLVNNPNDRVSFSCDSMKVSVESDGHTLASTVKSDCPPLSHDVNLTLRDVVLPESTSRDLKKGQEESGEIKFDVIIEASVKFKAWHWKQDHCMIRIFCAEVMAHFSRQTAFEQITCDVEIVST